jgi:U3 small nucleolar ribonucleoprotein protein IMP4
MIFLSIFTTQLSMLRRQARERRAYLHQKALAAKSNIAHLRKLKAHIDKDKALPKELQDPSLRKDLRYEEAQLTIDEAEQMDDEYYNMGMREPRILITTSRDPSSRLLQFSKVPFSLCSFAVEMLTSRKSALCCRIRHG